jgi:hypothetical protein
MMKHFFTEHLLKSDQSSMNSDFRMRMAHIYFVYTIQKNRYLANFLMLSFLAQHKSQLGGVSEDENY